MKKNNWIRGKVMSFRYRKIIQIMKLLLVFIFGCIIQSYALESKAQNTLVNLRFENSTLKEVLQKLEDVSEFSFIYKDELIKAKSKISGNFRDERLTDVLNKILENEDLTYKIDGHIIVILPNSSEMVTDQKKSTITGKVTDSSGAALPGVSVVVKGTTNGVITDANGTYSISNIPESAVLQFSFVGMKTQEIPVNGKSSINIVLEEETIGIEEVVAVGYGFQKKINVIGAVTSLSNKEITSSHVAGVSNTLAGRLPGVIVQQGSGQPGLDEATISIRGSSTLGDASPLVVVDGVPGRDLNSIEPRRY